MYVNKFCKHEINSGAGHSQSSRFYFAKQRPGKHVRKAVTQRLSWRTEKNHEKYKYK
jgi:hypothetical protein